MVIAMKERLKAFRRTKLYDLFAAAPVIAWFAFCMAQMLPSLAQRIALVKLFVRTDPSVLPATLVFRTVSEVSHAGFLRAVGCDVCGASHSAAGRARVLSTLCCRGRHLSSVGFLLLPPQELSYALYLASLLLIIAGTVFAICAVLVLGRSISLLPEARRLVTRGPYALVRHPLYLGEMVAVAGVALQYLSAWALLLLGLVWAFQLQRMKYEELVLFQSFPEYGDYMARTARLVPGVY